MSVPGVPAGTVFGSGQGTDSPQHSFQAQPDWYAVPTSWFATTDGLQNIFVSPNSDFSPPKYNAKINLDGFLVYQDMLRSRREGPQAPQGSA